MKYPAYPWYKDSGVQWLGEVPEGWEVKRLKMAAHLNDRKVEADEENPVPYIGMENIESWTGKLLPLAPDVVPSGVANRFTAKNTLFGKLRPYLAKACNPDFNGLCSTELLVIESEDFDRRALLYWLLADGFIKLVDSSTYGSKMPRANWDFIGNCMLPVPPLPEQTAIADFLDRKTRRIDTLVAKKRRLIALLGEKRTALISRTVTRCLPADAAREFGLEPHTRFKDSGIEWLDEVPDGWEVVTIKRLAASMICGPFGSSLTKDKYSETGYRVYGQEQVIPADFTIGDYYIPPDYFLEMKRYEVIPGDVLVSCVGTFGKVAVVPQNIEPGIINPRLILLRPKLNLITSDYLGICLRSRNAYEQLQSSSRGGTMDIINLGLLGELVIPLPPLPEQTAIATYLDRETATIDQLVAKVEAAIVRLLEYRTALITAAVTGEIDVRGEADKQGPTRTDRTDPD